MFNSRRFRTILFFLCLATVASVLADEGKSLPRELSQPEVAQVSTSEGETPLSDSSFAKAANGSVILVEGRPETALGRGFYLRVQDSYFFVVTLHALLNADGEAPVSIEWISLTSDGSTFAIDDSRGSLSRRRELERQGLVKKSSRVVRTDGRPLVCPDVDALVVKLAEPIPGLAPFVPSSAFQPAVGDAAIVTTCDGTTLDCSVCDPNFIDEDGSSRLRLIAKGTVFEEGQAGIPALDSTGAVLGALARIKNKGVKRVGDDVCERIVSDDSLCVLLKDILDAVDLHWK